MAIITLTHNNKNQYRKYPFKYGGIPRTAEGHILADSVIVNCSITSVYGLHRLYLKQIFRKNNTVNISVASVFDDTVLGTFAGDVLEDFTSLQLIPFVRFASGNITLGSLSSVQSINTVMNFSAENSELEESTIFCYKVPGVTSINDVNKNQVRGDVNFGDITNLSKETVAGKVLLSVENSQNIQNTADKSSHLDNCATPIIKTINGVTPSTAIENNGNVYLAGIKPIVFYGIPGENAEALLPGVIKIDAENMTLNTLCSEKYKTTPPVDISGITTPEGINMYYNKTSLTKNTQTDIYPYNIPQRVQSNVYEAELPEYYYWPQFVKREYYERWKLQAPSAPTITSVVTTSNGAVVHFKAPRNNGISSIVTYSYSLDSGVNWRTFQTTGTQTSFIVSSLLQPSTDYYLVLRAENSFISSGWGENSAVFKFTTLPLE